ncbi:GNAT family N-acetyltransferase/peptidase C39 family protein [Pseudoalteromonas xiamenensis]|uniref:GNAT family N-acetyltransferase/peptidase C39 family protein n=1 Tax=Pseudoalteromonas xiamenensis TaxID=882626 RepID=UPI0035E5B44C
MTNAALKVEDTPSAIIRVASPSDLNALTDLEMHCFSSDKLSRRSFKRWISAKHAILLVAELEGQVLGYGLVWCLKGTRLARLYSLAVSPMARGRGIAEMLLGALEQETSQRGRGYLRLEVSINNQKAIKLYQKFGYKTFGAYSDYYGDGSEALRMQKQIAHFSGDGVQFNVPWYMQTTEFTCGPAALMMAMGSLSTQFEPSQLEELEIWREATTIFMTSGHGGCHPIGLALSAQYRGFNSAVYLSTSEPLFLDGVRSDKKKNIMALVHEDFVAKAKDCGVALNYEDIKLASLESMLNDDVRVLALISTYRLDGKKAPHWVCVTAMDSHSIYVHDPELATNQVAIDCQHVPIAKTDFEKMSSFGSARLKAIITLRN